MSDTTFRLSRVYAEGWIKARALSADDRDGIDQSRIAALNPYATEPERSRWNDGFREAVEF